MSDYKFKVGDKVRVVSQSKFSTTAWTDYNNGKEFTIKSCETGGGCSKNGLSRRNYYVRDGGGDAYEEDLELIEPQYKKLTPKVGDKFRVVKELFHKSGKCYNKDGGVGREITFNGIQGNYGFSINKNFLYSEDCLTTEYLEPVEEKCLCTGRFEECDGCRAPSAAHISNGNVQGMVNDAYNALCDNQQWHNNRLYTWNTNAATSLGVSDYTAPSTLTNIKTKTMNLIKKAMLTADQKVLIKAGYLDSELDMTQKGKEAIDFLVYQAHEKALVEMAKEVVKEQEAKK